MKVLIIGLGSIAQKHIKAIRAIDPEAELIALRSSAGKSENADDVKNIFSLDELSVEVDFILISNPTYMHADTIRSVLPLNKPLFIEKPVLSSVAEGGALSGMLKEKKLITYIGCNLRFHPLLVYLKNHIGKKRINEVNVYCGSYLPDWRPNKDFRTIYSVDPEKGGGVHLDLVHEIDYTYWLFGKPVAIRSTARSASSLNIASYDYASYCLTYPDFAVNVVLNYYRRDAKREIEIVAEDTTWKADLLSSELTDLVSGKQIFSSKEKIIDTYRLQMENFISCIRTDKMPMNNFDEALEVLKITLHEL